MAPNADQQNALNIQNQGRIRKGLPSLQWDDSLASQAQSYAQYLAQVLGRLQHSGIQGQGENIYWLSNAPGFSTPCATAAQSWMNEGNKYHGEAIGSGNLEAVGHYTQCMWRSTTRVGMGSVADNKGGVYIVARYTPPGNYIGQTPF